MCAAGWTTPACFAGSSLLRGSRQHRILGSDPTLSTVTQKWRQALIDRRGTNYARLPHFDQYGPFCVGQEAGSDFYQPQLISGAAVSTCVAHRVPKLLQLPRPKELSPKIFQLLSQSAQPRL